MAAVFSRLPMRVRCATQRDRVFHPEMNYSQTQLDQLDRLTERWVADHLQKGKTSKENKELVTLEDIIKHKIGLFLPLVDLGRGHHRLLGNARARSLVSSQNTTSLRQTYRSRL